MLFDRLFSKPDSPLPHTFGQVGLNPAGSDPKDSLQDRIPAQPGSRLYDPLLQDLCLYWDRKRSGRWAPAPADIVPQDIGHLLPHLIFVTVQQAPLRLDCAIVGDDVAGQVGHDIAGAQLYPLEPSARPTLSQIWALTCLTPELLLSATQRKSHYASGRYSDAAKSFKRVQRVVLPFSSDGEEVSLLLAGLVFQGTSLAGKNRETAGNSRQVIQ